MRLAIVGLHETFFFILRPHLERAGVRIVSVFGGNGNEQRAAQLADELGATCAESIEQVIGIGCDGALVGDWYCDRPARIIPLLEAGVPAMSTKVLAADYPQTLQVIETARRTGTVLMSGSAYRHAPPVLQLIEAVRAGDWGRPVFARMIMPHGMGTSEDRRDCGGMLTHYALHPLSPLVGILGGTVERVSAFGGVYNHDDLQTEDAVVVIVQFDHDAIVVAEVLACQQPDYPATVPELDLHCTQRSVRISFPEGPAADWYGRPIHNPQLSDAACGYTDWFNTFTRAIEQGAPPVALDEYLEVAAALHLARLSRDHHRTTTRADL